MFFSSNQNAGFFDQQYLPKESVDILKFLCEDDHHRNVGSETIITFGWMWLSVPLIWSDCKIISLTIFLEGIN